jgi:hypothetical protein
MQLFYDEEIEYLKGQLVHQQQKTAVLWSPDVPTSKADHRVRCRIQPNIENEADTSMLIEHKTQPPASADAIHNWGCYHTI